MVNIHLNDVLMVRYWQSF